MNLLAVDTATPSCSVALQLGDAVRCEERRTDTGHARIVLPMIDSLLAQAGIALTQLDAVAVGRGPGSFTGIRIGLGVVQGLCLGADLAAVGVSSLATLAQGCARDHVVAAFDARMGQIYVACYRRDDGLAIALNPPEVIFPDALVLPGGQWFGAGSAFSSYAAPLCDGVEVNSNATAKIVDYDATAQPSARSMLPLARHALDQGEAVAAADLVPLYVRNAVTTPVKRAQ